MANVFYEHASAELATLTNTFSVSGTPTDPNTVSLVITDPAGTATTYTYAASQITKVSTGVYSKDIPCTADGIWTYTWIGTGAASDVVAGTWTVFNTELSKLYCSVEELKSRLGISDTQDDFELRLAIDAASRWLDDQYCHRHFWRGTSTRTFAADSWYELAVDDLVSVTALKTDAAGDGTFETTWDSSDYQLLPVNAATRHAEARPYTCIKAIASRTFPVAGDTRLRTDRVQVEAVWGWPAIPTGIKQATLIIAAETFKLKDTFAGRGGFGEWAGEAVRRSPQALDYARPFRKHAVLVA
jgi:hypothetical protein